MESGVLTLCDYQERAMSTCTHSSWNFSYMFLNLVGEVGEFASKIAKAIRKETAMIDGNYLMTERAKVMSDDEIRELRLEAGDILWQLSGLCSVMGWRLEDIANENLVKLSSRKSRNVIIGDGDNR